MIHTEYILCWASEFDSDWEILDGESALKERVLQLKEANIKTIYAFKDQNQIDLEELFKEEHPYG